MNRSRVYRSRFSHFKSQCVRSGVKKRITAKSSLLWLDTCSHPHAADLCGPIPIYRSRPSPMDWGLHCKDKTVVWLSHLHSAKPSLHREPVPWVQLIYCYESPECSNIIDIDLFIDGMFKRRNNYTELYGIIMEFNIHYKQNALNHDCMETEARVLSSGLSYSEPFSYHVPPGPPAGS